MALCKQTQTESKNLHLPLQEGQSWKGWQLLYLEQQRVEMFPSNLSSKAFQSFLLNKTMYLFVQDQLQASCTKVLNALLENQH